MWKVFYGVFCFFYERRWRFYNFGMWVRSYEGRGVLGNLGFGFESGDWEWRSVYGKGYVGDVVVGE